jgi:hypothetical protein
MANIVEFHDIHINLPCLKPHERLNRINNNNSKIPIKVNDLEGYFQDYKTRIKQRINSLNCNFCYALCIGIHDHIFSGDD